MTLNVEDCEYIQYELEEDGNSYYFCKIAPKGTDEQCENFPKCIYRKYLQEKQEKEQLNSICNLLVEEVGKVRTYWVEHYNKEVETANSFIATIESICNSKDFNQKTIIDEVTKIKDISSNFPNVTDECRFYGTWGKSIMDEIEKIAKDKYPDIPYWCDTGSRWNVCMAMLDRFRRDIKR